jgi:hypothetical protein
MGKSQKSKRSVRVDEVLKLLTVGAQQGDIKRYADQHGWGISERQIRRYVSDAHEQFAKLARADREKLLGRHIAQRGSLYAKAVKDGDLRTALLIAKDEAKLQGLYPRPLTQEEADKERLRKLLHPGVKTTVSRKVRTARLLMAQANKDSDAEKLVKESTPYGLYRLPDTTMPEQMLHIMALIYVTEQLDYAGMVMNAVIVILKKDPNLRSCAEMLAAGGYLFKVGREGWAMFCTEIGVDPGYLVSENYRGQVLGMVGEHVASYAMTEAEVRETLFEGHPEMKLQTAADVARTWRRMFEEVSRELE